MSNVYNNLRNTGMQASIIIPSLKRPVVLQRCIESLNKQTYRNFEKVIIQDDGPLAKIRNQGADKAKGEILVFIDDDVVCPPTWLEAIVSVFSKLPQVGGVSGPAIIPAKYKANRDITRFKLIKRLYDTIFLEGKANLPGLITKAGTWTTGAMEDVAYEGEVDYLEACNMAFRKEVFYDAGKFDETFRGVGDWSEPDLAFRVRERYYKLWFSQSAKCFHYPDKTGPFRKRNKDNYRVENYRRFASKWVRPSKKHSMYLLFLKTYYKIKGTI